MVETRSKKRQYVNDCEELVLTKKRKINPIEESPENDKLMEESFESDEESSESDITENSESDNEIDIKAEMSNMLSSSLKIYQQLLQTKTTKRRIEDMDRDYNPNIDTFNEFVENIHDGNFFERIRYDESKKYTEMNDNEIIKLNKELKDIQKIYLDGPNIIDIVKLKIPIETKKQLLESVFNLENCEVLSPEYNYNLKYIENTIKESSRDPKLIELEKKLKCHSKQDSYKTRILKSEMSFDNKIIAYQKLEIMESYEQGHSDEFIKYKNWMDTLLLIPFSEYNKLPVTLNSPIYDLHKYICSVRNMLDSELSFLEKPKDQIINIVAQMIRNPNCNINAIGLYGPKGTGKSSIANSIAKALNRPLRTISLGGESDSSNLTGHNFTYVGSQPGRFIEILKETQTMSPIFLLDELDKISNTDKSQEIIGTLIHLTDSTTNKKYNLDKYYSGIEFDLSKALFIFTYNDPKQIDKILSDRLYKIKVDNYNFKEKLEIANKHLINMVLEKLKLNMGITFDQNAIEYLIRSSESDVGMRGIKTKIEIILTRINMLLLTNPSDNIIKLKYKKLYTFYRTLPVIIPKEHIDTLLDESTSLDFNDNPPFMMYI